MCIERRIWSQCREDDAGQCEATGLLSSRFCPHPRSPRAELAGREKVKRELSLRPSPAKEMPTVRKRGQLPSYLLLSCRVRGGTAGLSEMPQLGAMGEPR